MTVNRVHVPTRLHSSERVRWQVASHFKFNVFHGSPFCTCLASSTALFSGLPALASTEIAAALRLPRLAPNRRNHASA
jgi:hypothetical protein